VAATRAGAGAGAGDSPFAVMHGKYDVEQFQIPATDARGHTTRAQCYIQPGHDRQIDEILGNRRFPFRTKGDLIRWCIVRGLERLLAMESDIPDSYMSQVDAMLDVLRDTEFQQSFDSTIQIMTTRITSLLGEGAQNEARRVVSQMLHKVGQMKEGYWRDKWDAKVRGTWGYLLDGPGVPIRGSDNGSGTT
jgi:hypothetical protein